MTVQHQLNNTTSVEVAYIGNKGTHGFAGDGNTYNVNAPAIGAGTAVVTAAGAAPSFTPNVPQVQRRPYYNAFTYTNYPDPSSATGFLMCCSTDQGNYLGNDASSIYNALQVKIDKRFSHGFQLLSHYTYAHANKYDSGYYVNSHVYSYGPDDQVRNSAWITSGVYELPFGKGKPFAGNSGRAEDLIVGGWQISGTTNWSGGLPWTPSFSNCGQVNDLGLCRPNADGSFHTDMGSFNPVTHERTFFTPIPTLAYPVAALATGVDTCDSGPAHRPRVLYAGLRTTRQHRLRQLPRSVVFYADASLMKKFSITERVKRSSAWIYSTCSITRSWASMRTRPVRGPASIAPAMATSPTSKPTARRVRPLACARSNSRSSSPSNQTVRLFQRESFGTPSLFCLAYNGACRGRIHCPAVAPPSRRLSGGRLARLPRGEGVTRDLLGMAWQTRGSGAHLVGSPVARIFFLPEISRANCGPSLQSRTRQLCRQPGLRPLPCRNL